MRDAMKKWMICGFALLLSILCITGCGKNEEAAVVASSEEEKEIVPSGEYIPVAEFQEVNFRYFYDPNVDYVWYDDSFLYRTFKWNNEYVKNISTFYQVDIAGKTEPVQVHETPFEEDSISDFIMARNKNFYIMTWRFYGQDKYFTLHKYDEEGQLIKSVALNTDHISSYEQNRIYEMWVDSFGNVIMEDFDNNIYAFDADLNYLFRTVIPDNFSTATYVDAGEQGIYFGNYDSSTKQASFLKLDMEKKMLVDAGDISLKQFISNYEYACLLSGYEKGILISSNSTLFQYNPQTGELIEWIDWADTNINVDGVSVKEIIFATETEVTMNEDGAPTKPLMKMLCYEEGNTAELVELSEIDKAYLPEKQTITLGTMATSNHRDWVKMFNRSTREYEVVLKEYADMEEFTNSLILEPEEIPDILDVSFISSDMLESKGLLEDLRPYFEQSELVSREDILPKIWEICTPDEELNSMIIDFYFQSCVTTVDTISQDGWSADEFFTLQEQYPDSRPLVFFREATVWRILGEAGTGAYIDWDTKTCNFDSKEFQALLEQINNLDYTNAPRVTSYDNNYTTNALLKGEALINQDSYWTPYDYRVIYKKYKGKVYNIGYPTQDGEPCYMVMPVLKYSIYAESEKKEGAWAFIEYLLSEEVQDWYGSKVGAFPVRQESFEEFLTKPHDPYLNFVGDDKDIDCYEVFMHMIEHSYLNPWGYSGTIDNIITEELEAFYAGDKTAEETSELIQNRVQLYLDENY